MQLVPARKLQITIYKSQLDEVISQTLLRFIYFVSK